MKGKIIKPDQTSVEIPLPDHDPQIAELAFNKVENRGFEQGYQLDD